MTNPPNRAAYLEGRVVYLRLQVQRWQRALEGAEGELAKALAELAAMRARGELEPGHELRLARHLAELRERLAWKAPAIPNQGGRP